MTDGHEGTALAPVRGRERIDVLDVLRGLAILGILFMNMPYMGGPILAEMRDMRLGGWTQADRWTQAILGIVAEGTQRGTLEMLFGAGMLILTTRAAEAGRPVAGLYLRRTLWLLAFGMADVFLLLWPGDILHIYAIAALLLFPFRRLPARAMMTLGLIWATLSFADGFGRYVETSRRAAEVQLAGQADAAGRPLTPEQKRAVRSWNQALDEHRLHAEQRQGMATEVQARRGALPGYAKWLIVQWIDFARHTIVFTVIEALSTMLIGAALYRWGVIQGLRSRRFYLVGAMCSYGFGLTARVIGIAETYRFLPLPQTIDATGEYARLAVTFGHICVVNLLLQTAPGHALLHPFKAAGRTAFSLYACETIAGVWILFPGFGFGLWDRFGWFGLAMVALAVQAALLVLANIWVRYFDTGPLEWAWRSLAYQRRQPFRRRGRPRPVLVGP